MILFSIFMECEQRAEVIIQRFDSNTIDISIRNSDHFGMDMINDAWIRLNHNQIRDIIKDINLYLNNITFIRKIYEMQPKFGFRNFMSIEVSDYTNTTLEIIISNGSRLFSAFVSETFVRLQKNDAILIRDQLLKMIDE